MDNLLWALLVLSFLACKPRTAPEDNVKQQDIPVAHHNRTHMQQDTISPEFLMGRFKPEDHEDFKIVPIKYADREGLYLQSVVLDSFQRMYDAAMEDGIKLVIRSATRNFDYQKGIWERKWTGATTLSDGTKATDIDSPVARAKKILEYSSMPGTSRHHWGTDFDVNAFNNAYFSSGEGLKVYDWLKANAEQYGFCQPYTSKSSGRSGYNEEKWHWSFLPISSAYTQAVKDKVSNKMIEGFKGAEAAEAVDMVNNYMLGINPDCF